MSNSNDLYTKLQQQREAKPAYHMDALTTPLQKAMAIQELEEIERHRFVPSHVREVIKLLKDKVHAGGDCMIDGDIMAVFTSFVINPNQNRYGF